MRDISHPRGFSAALTGQHISGTVTVVHIIDAWELGFMFACGSLTAACFFLIGYQLGDLIGEACFGGKKK